MSDTDHRMATKRAVDMLAPIVMQSYDMRKASEALLSIYNPSAMPSDIAAACSKLLLWTAAQASAKASELMENGKPT